MKIQVKCVNYMYFYFAKVYFMVHTFNFYILEAVSLEAICSKSKCLLKSPGLDLVCSYNIQQLQKSILNTYFFLTSKVHLKVSNRILIILLLEK